jgi:hypothetical protein
VSSRDGRQLRIKRQQSPLTHPGSSLRNLPSL